MKKWFMSLAAFALSFGVLGACNMAGDNDANDDTENMRYENVRYNNGDGNGVLDNDNMINDQLGDRDNDGIIDYDNQEPDLGEEPNEDRNPGQMGDDNRLRNINDYRDGNMGVDND